MHKISFDCLDCALNYYEKLEEEKKYLMDNFTNKLIKNTYGWKNA